jgi:hypothetical protein
MKKLLNIIFKKEKALNYILPKYQPSPAEMVNTQVSNADYYSAESSNDQEIDEMQIDRIYGCQ